MSKSLKRVLRALNDAGADVNVHEMADGTRTAADAARAVDCHIDQIAKSIIFQGQESGEVYLFITAGGNQVDQAKARAVAGEPMGKADAGVIRSVTGFAIGGVAPIGHLNAVKSFWDQRLSEFETVWAAAGTPRHVFPINPVNLQRISNAQTADFLLGKG